MGRSQGSRESGAAFPDDLPALTAVRFWLALGVVLFHYQLQWPWDPWPHTGVFNRARLGVDVFFILSGFVLTHAYRRALETRAFHYRRFVTARLARIYPAHLAVLGFILMMVVVARWVGAEFDRAYYNPEGFVLTLFMLQAWGPELVRAEWNGPSWSLSAEWFAYLTFPIFAAIGLILRHRPIVLLVLSAVLFVAVDQAYGAAFGRPAVHAEVNLGIVRIIPEFLYGIALYRLGETLRPSRAAAVCACVASALVIGLLMHAKADDRLIVATAGPVVLSLALLSKVGADRIFASRAALVAGEASYALYLVHMPLLIGWKGVHSALSAKPSTYVLDWWEVTALLAMTLSAALMLHFAVEAPARSLIRRWSDRAWPKAEARDFVTPGSQPPDL